MTFMVHFSVKGDPVGKGRPRFRRAGNFVQTYTDAKTAGWEKEVAQTAARVMKDQEPLKTPVAVYLYFGLGIPKSYSKKRTTACLDGLEGHTKRPDLDNLCKSVLDGMNGVVFEDDNQIVSLHAKKVWSTDPGVEVLVKEELE